MTAVREYWSIKLPSNATPELTAVVRELNKIFIYLSQESATIQGLDGLTPTINILTALRIVATDASKRLTSVADLTDWIAGTLNRVIVTNDGDGTLTLSCPQDIAVSSSPTFIVATLSGLTTSRLIASNGSKKTVSVANLASWIAGTNNRITITNDGDGTITLSTPQDIATDSSPIFLVNVDRYTSNQTLTASNHHVACDTDGGGFTISLPAGIAGTTYRIANTGTSNNNLTISPNGAELLISANSDFTLFDGETLIITYDSTEGWF